MSVETPSHYPAFRRQTSKEFFARHSARNGKRRGKYKQETNNKTGKGVDRNLFFPDRDKKTAGSIYLMSVEGLKQQGNAAFGRGDFQSALDCFQQGLVMNDEQGGETVMKSVLLSNCSAALCNLGNFTAAMAKAQECIMVRPKWCKGYYRLFNAAKGAGDQKLAHLNIDRALCLEPCNKELLDAKVELLSDSHIVQCVEVGSIQAVKQVARTIAELKLLFRNHDRSPVMDKCGIPLCVRNTGHGKQANQVACYFMIKVESGIAAPHWQSEVGTVLMYRADFKDFFVADVWLLWDFFCVVLDDFGEEEPEMWREYDPDWFHKLITTDQRYSSQGSGSLTARPPFP